MNSTLPDYLQTLGEQLESAWDHRYGRRRAGMRFGRGTAVRAGLVVATAAAVVAVVLIRGSGPGAVAEAAAAAGKAPDAAIVHFTSVTRDASGTLTGRTELWGATSPPFAQRSILQGDANDGPPIEQGATGNAVTQFDPAGIVYVRTAAGGIAEGTKATDLAADAERVKTFLREGDARDEGERNVGGRVVHRFVVTPPGGGTCIYDVEPATFYGRSLTCTGLPSGSLSEQWEYLPRQGHERLLSVVAQHPSAKIDRAPLGACGNARHTPSTPPCVATVPGA
jgi:hypothetical protein